LNRRNYKQLHNASHQIKTIRCDHEHKGGLEEASCGGKTQSEDDYLTAREATSTEYRVRGGDRPYRSYRHSRCWGNAGASGKHATFRQSALWRLSGGHESTARRESAEACWHNLVGKCSKGEKCYFSHEVVPTCFCALLPWTVLLDVCCALLSHSLSSSPSMNSLSQRFGLIWWPMRFTNLTFPIY